jgi:hypothetical protein
VGTGSVGLNVIGPRSVGVAALAASGGRSSSHRLDESESTLLCPARGIMGRLR